MWWLVHPSTKQVVAAFEDPQYGGLRELPLPRCVEIWGWNPPEAEESRDRDGGGSTGIGRNRDLQQEHAESAGGRTSPTGPPSLTQNHITVSVHGHDVVIPRVPRKFVNFLRARRSVYREISNMAKLGKIGRDGEVGPKFLAVLSA